MSETKYNRRFVLFARSIGKTPEQFIADNRVEYGDGLPDGANMSEFMIWISQQLCAFREESPRSFALGKYGSLLDNEAFGMFLEKEFG